MPKNMGSNLEMKTHYSRRSSVSRAVWKVSMVTSWTLL